MRGKSTGTIVSIILLSCLSIRPAAGKLEAAVIGDWEGSTLDGWIHCTWGPAGYPQLVCPSTTGATLNSASLKAVQPLGWYWLIQHDFGYDSAEVDAFTQCGYFEMDVTRIASQWVHSDADDRSSRFTVAIQGGEPFFFGRWDDLIPWDGSADSTETLRIDYSSIVPDTKPTWLQVLIATTTNGFTRGGTYYLDRAVFAPGPSAHSPQPSHGAKNTIEDVILGWATGVHATAHDVYFGTSFSDVSKATATTRTPGIYRGRQSQPYYPVGPLTWGAVYYWRVDEICESSVQKGKVWNFEYYPLVPPQVTTCRIVSWNIEFLGSRDPVRTPEQLEALAERITTFGASLLVLQEIADYSVLESDVCSQMDASWRTYGQHGNEEALLYDRSKVQMVSAEILSNLNNPPYTAYPGENYRRPITGVFHPIGAHSKPFRVIGVHCHWSDPAIRSRQGAWLRDKIAELLEDPSEPSDIMLLGDFNGEPGASPHLELQDGNVVSLIPKENGDTTGVLYPGNIDHFYVTHSARSSLLKPSSFVIRCENYGETPRNFEETYSDHYPIFMDLAVHSDSTTSPVEEQDKLFEGFENGFASLGWSSQWGISTSVSHSGSRSVRAGEIGDDEQTSLSITLDCDAGEIRFWRKVSCESNWDYLEFFIDGSSKAQWSGESDWQEVAFPVKEGKRTFTWTYSKDSTGSAGADSAWIDDITFPVQ